MSSFTLWHGLIYHPVYMYSTDGITVETGEVVPNCARWVTLSSFGSYGSSEGSLDLFYPIINQVYMYSTDGTTIQTGATIPANAKWVVLSSFDTWLSFNYYQVNNQGYIYSIDGSTALTGNYVPANAKWATLGSFYHAGPMGFYPIVNQIFTPYSVRTAPSLSLTTSDNQGLNTGRGDFYAALLT